MREDREKHSTASVQWVKNEFRGHGKAGVGVGLHTDGLPEDFEEDLFQKCKPPVAA